MKKFYILIFIAISVIFNDLISAPVGIETIEKAALNVYVENNNFTKAPDDVIAEIIPVKKESIELYYIVNYKADAGFAIFAADDRSVPLLCFSFEHNFDEKFENPAFYDWADNYKSQLIEIIENDYPQTTEIKERWLSILESPASKDRLMDHVDPLLSISWNQGCYYNKQCPEDGGGPCGHVLVGCGAVAMAQVMKYYNHPTTGEGSNSYDHSDYGTLSANFGETTYEWSKMPIRLTANNSQYHDYVAKLLYHCGVAVYMDYGTSGSSTYFSLVKRAMIKHFKYPSNLEFLNKSDYSEDEWEQILRDELDDSRPLLYRGADPDYGGHLFNCDGYKNDDYFHFNWGWGGYYDGYYYVSSLNPGSYDFTEHQSIVRYIDPDGPSIRLKDFTGGNYCVAGSISIEFTVDYPFSSGNVFTLQLSDKDGSFLDSDDITDLGTLNGQNSGTIHGSIPGDIEESENYRIRIIASDPEQISVTNNSTLTISNPDVSHSQIPDVCGDKTDYELEGGTPSDGYYTGDHVHDIKYFNAQEAGPGNHSVYYVYQDEYGCRDSVQLIIKVNPLPNVTMDEPAIYCINDKSADLDIGNPSGGYYTGDGIVNPDGEFDPGEAGVGEHVITYTYEDDNGCINSAETTITVKALPEVTTKKPDIFCIDDYPVDLKIGEPSGGVYSGEGIINPDGRFDPSEAGEGKHAITYSYQDEFGCENSAETTITVKPLPEVTMKEVEPLCIDAEPVDLDGKPEGGTYSGGRVNQEGMFDPSVSGAGSHIVEYTYQDEDGCSNTAEQTIVVNPLPEIIIEYDEFVCINKGLVEIIADPAGGSFDGNGIVEDNYFDPAIAGVGEHTLEYTYTDANGCTNSKEITITAAPMPEVSLESAGPFCRYDEPVQLNAEPNGGIFEGSEVTSDGEFDPKNAGTGTHEAAYIYQAENGCSDTAEIDIVVNPMPEEPNIKVENYSIVCSNGNYAEYQWYLDDELLENETGEKIIPLESGNYKLEVSNKFECRAISEELFFEYTDVHEQFGTDAKIEIVPNPAGTKAYVKLTAGKTQRASLYFTDLLGNKEIMLENIKLNEGINTYPLSIEHLNSGVYVVSIVIDGELLRVKFIKTD